MTLTPHHAMGLSLVGWIFMHDTTSLFSGNITVRIRQIDLILLEINRLVSDYRL